MGETPTLRLGQDGASPPRHSPVSRQILQWAVAEVRSTVTPGPMVEDSDTFFR